MQLIWWLKHNRTRQKKPRRKCSREIIVVNRKHILADYHQCTQWGGGNNLMGTNITADWWGGGGVNPKVNQEQFRPEKYVGFEEGI